MAGKNYLKLIRIILSGIIFVSMAVIFVLSGLAIGFIPAGILSLQIVPSLLKLFSAAGFLSGIGFIIILILTFVTGRVYCSILCPLGIFFDICGFAAKKLRKKKKIRYIKAQPYIQLPVLAAVILTAFSGSLFLLSLLDPYSIFGRIAMNLLKPAVIIVNNLLVLLFEQWDIFFFRTIISHSAGALALIVSVMIFTGLGILAFFKGRWYCTTICPVGTFLGFLSAFSLFRIRINRQTCNSCMKCESICRAACISSSKKLIDNSRCIRCFDCLSVCPQSAIGFQPGLVSKKIETLDTEKRRFLAAGITVLCSTGIALAFRSFVRPQLLPGENFPAVSTGNFPVQSFAGDFPALPPGSISLDHFLSHCTNCHLCVSVCPSRVIGIGSALGPMSPYMNYQKGFCSYECSKCGEVCPTKAIRDIGLKEKKITRIGAVYLDTDRCIVKTKHENCGACAEHCPTHAVYTVPYQGLNLPEIDTRFCIGCGACENVCPVRPMTAIHVQPLAIHEKASAPSERKQKGETLIIENDNEDFPF